MANSIRFAALRASWNIIVEGCASNLLLCHSIGVERCASNLLCSNSIRKEGCASNLLGCDCFLTVSNLRNKCAADGDEVFFHKRFVLEGIDDPYRVVRAKIALANMFLLAF